MIEPSAVVSAKRELRERAKARRSAIPAEVRDQGAARVAGIGLGFASVDPPAVVSAFLAIGEEIDPAPLLERLHGEGWRTALPVMAGKGKPLLFRKWSMGEALETVMWGIRQPLATATLVEPDVLLVPLLAFERSGVRLGYGGGFYDRTIQQLRSRRSIVTVGLAFSEQEVDAVPHLDYDQRLDWVLTPEGPIRCVAQ